MACSPVQTGRDCTSQTLPPGNRSGGDSLWTQHSIRQVEAYERDIVRSICTSIPFAFFSFGVRPKTRYGFRQVQCGAANASRYLALMQRTAHVLEWVQATYEELPPNKDLRLHDANVLPLSVCEAAEASKNRGILVVEHNRFLMLVMDTTDGFRGSGKVRLYAIPEEPSYPARSSLTEGQSESERTARKALYGKNCMDVPVLSRWTLFGKELLHPFFIFQVLVILLWVADAYYAYSIAILLTSAAGAWLQAHEIHENSKRLATLAAGVSPTGDPNSYSDLVPGDSIEVTYNFYVPADCTLVAGGALVNEASLTGECGPVRKFAWKDGSAEFNWKDSEVSLYAGSRVISCRKGSRAVVRRIACSTLRGKLVREIVLQETHAGGWLGASQGPRPDSENGSLGIGNEIYFVLLFLALMGVIGAIWSARLFSLDFRLSTKDVVIKSLDLITIAVPPALPATVNFGLAFAFARLQAQGILCVRASAIPRSGQAEIICFDKTGTLTESGLNVHTVYYCVPRTVLPSQTDRMVPPTLQLISKCPGTATSDKIPTPLRLALACCHSLSLIDGKLCGDDVDLNLFRLSKFSLVDQSSKTPEEKSQSTDRDSSKGGSGNEQSETYFQVDDGEQTLKIIRILEFRSDLSRQGTIAVQNFEPGRTRLNVYLKGAPEVIAKLSDSNTVPMNLQEVINEHTLLGHRVVAMAGRELAYQAEQDPYTTALSMPRSDLERGLIFLGLLILENPMKCDTVAVLAEGSGYFDIRVVTGDHALTALSVAQMSGILARKRSSKCIQVKALTVRFADQTGYGRNAEDKVERGFQFVSVGGDVTDRICSYSRDQVFELDYRSTNSSSPLVLVATGDVLDMLGEDEKMRDLILRRGVVYARMSPDQKGKLIRMLRERLRQNVLMCGDGANDVSALREADTGVAVSSRRSIPRANDDRKELREIVVFDRDMLSRDTSRTKNAKQSKVGMLMPENQEEASLCASFTSRAPSIAGVFEVIHQGRASAAASLAAMQYMFMYSVVQFTSVLLLYSVGGLVSDGQYLFADLFLVLPLGVLMGRLDASQRFSRKPPPRSIWVTAVILPTVLMAAIQVVFQLFIFYQVLPTIPRRSLEGSNGRASLVSKAPLVTGMFLFVNMQFIWTAVALNIGWPHRRPIYTSSSALFGTMLITSVSLLLLSFPPTWAMKWLEMVDLGRPLRLKLIYISLLNFLCTVGVMLLTIEGTFGRQKEVVA